MRNSLTFLNASWFWPVVICWVILILIFIWKEWRTSGKRRLLFKIFLGILAVTSLALLALKPAIPKEIKEGRVVIITENFKQKQLDSLKKEFRNLKVIDYGEEETLPRLADSKEVFVLGSGIPSYDLWAFENIPTTYLPGEELSGIIKLNYKQENKVGKRLEVRGEFVNPKLKNRLVLEDAGGTALDSVVFDSDKNVNFNLSPPLNVSGNYVFSITEKDSLSEVINRNFLPIKVAEKQNLRILILNAYPTFEIKYLKNFLAELGHEVVVKNRITTERFKFEFFNTDRMTLDRLNSSNLQDFELLILDSGSLNSLSNSERNALQKSISASGLGILILGEANTFSAFGDFYTFNPQRVSATEVVLNDLTGVSLNSQPYQLKKEFGLEEIHSSNSSILSAYKRIGQGRIGSTLLENTWQLQLEGKQDAYQQIWSKIVEQLSKRTSEIVSWPSENEFVFKDEPFSFQIRTSLEHPRVLDRNNRLIPLKQDFKSSELWIGKTYPRETGWQTLKMEQDSILNFDYYVFDSKDWQSLKSYQDTQENRRFFQKEPIEKEEKTKTPVAINPLWFYVLFLLAIGGLWLEPKL